MEHPCSLVTSFIPPRPHDVDNLLVEEYASLRKLSAYLWTRVKEDFPIGCTITRTDVFPFVIEECVRPSAAKSFLREVITDLPNALPPGYRLECYTGSADTRYDAVTISRLDEETNGEWFWGSYSKFAIFIRKN